MHGFNGVTASKRRDGGAYKERLELPMSALNKIPVEPGEATIKEWTILYEPPGGGKFNGKLRVTNQRLLYDAKFDMSAAAYLERHLSVTWGSDGGVIIIPKGRITDVAVKKSMLAKRVIVTLDDGSRHTFNYGALNIDPVASAIQQR
jgi:hypothetical protein